MRTSNTKCSRNILGSSGGDPREQTDGRTDTVSLLFVAFIHSIEETRKRKIKIKFRPFRCDHVNTNSERSRSQNCDSNTVKCRILLRLT